MENKVYKEDLEGKTFDRWWRWVEYETDTFPQRG